MCPSAQPAQAPWQGGCSWVSCPPEGGFWGTAAARPRACSVSPGRSAAGKEPARGLSEAARWAVVQLQVVPLFASLPALPASSALPTGSDTKPRSPGSLPGAATQAASSPSAQLLLRAKPTATGVLSRCLRVGPREQARCAGQGWAQAGSGARARGSPLPFWPPCTCSI